MAPLSATTGAARFFVLQYIPACDEGSLDEKKEDDFYEKANREGDDEREKDKDWDVNWSIMFLLGTGITHKLSKVLVTFYVRMSGGGDLLLYLVAAKTSLIKTKG